jgi:MYXO-CTERM domain-containing protein
MDGEMRIYNGADGTLKTSFALPDASAHDAIIIANFSKNPVPQDIVVKDRFSQAWALDKGGKLLWTYSGTTGHYPWPYDADGDGRDELFIGYTQLDYLGNPRYASPITIDHPDNIWIGDVDGDPTNGFEVLYGLSRKPSTQCVSARTGEVLWTNSDMTESQQILLADYRPDLPGLETYGLDRTVLTAKDSLFLLDSSGKTLWKETCTNGGAGTAIKPVHNWDGTNAPMVLAFKRGSGSAQVWDGKNTLVYKLPMDGNAVVGDFGGDSKQEVLMYSKSTANIYAMSQLDYDQPAPNPGHALRQPKDCYNYSRYYSGEAYALGTIPGPTNPNGDAGAAGAGGTSGSGGTDGAGGATGFGGTAAGGTTATGGTGGTGVGGIGTGGTTATGGPGGATAAAGAGAVATGGTRPVGGSTSAGGAITPVGGTTSTGGVPNPGGTVAGSGGFVTAGGGEASGGAVSLGGTVDTGGIYGNAGTSGAAITGAGGTDSKGALGRARGCNCRVAEQPARSTGLAGLGLLGLMALLCIRKTGHRAIIRAGRTRQNRVFACPVSAWAKTSSSWSVGRSSEPPTFRCGTERARRCGHF